MNREFETILDECLARLQAGASVEDCLARHPEHAEALQPLLTLASSVREVAIPSPDPAAVSANKQRMLAAVQAKTAPTPARSAASRSSLLAWLNRPPAFFRGIQARPFIRAITAIAIVILVVVLSTGGLVTTAADSLPGDALYPVKRMAEDMRLTLTLGSAARERLKTEFAQERQEEVWSVLDAGRSTDVEFQGSLEQMGDGYWIISGLKVTQSNNTVIEGQPLMGATVTVRAASAGDGSLRALHLQVDSEPTMMPTAQATDGEEPEFSDHPEPGEKEERHLTSTPGPKPFATEEPEPTEQPEPHATRGPEPTDEPDATEAHEPEATHQPDPTEAHEPEAPHQPDPTEAHEPEATHQPDSAEVHEPEPTHQSGPTEIHGP